MANSEETIYPGDLTREQIQEHIPLGWRWHMTKILEHVERWQMIAQAVGDPLPSLGAFQRDFKPLTGGVIPWLHWNRLPLGSDQDGEWECQQVETIQAHMRRLLVSCEACGNNGLVRKDDRGQGGYLVLCDSCYMMTAGWLLSTVPGEIGGPREPLRGRGGAWEPAYDDRDWVPGKDEEDDARDGEDPTPF